jgi:hypothetical protein
MAASGPDKVYRHFGGMYYILSTSESKSKQQVNFYHFTKRPIPEHSNLLTVLPRDLEISYIDTWVTSKVMAT